MLERSRFVGQEKSKREVEAGNLTVWTVGHSTRDIGAFLSVISAYDIECVADVRRFPASRRWPQFTQPALAEALAEHGIAYRWLPALGGRRRPLPHSPNNAWQNAAFRGYADHVLSEEFASGMFELLLLAYGLRTVVMCAEVLWWRCHRRIIADVLTALEVRVVHIRDEGHAEVHRLGPPARIVRGQLSYETSPGVRA